MALDERSRHLLQGRLDEVLGADAADTLMAHLPPVGWADVATKRDLDTLADRIDLQFDAAAERIDLRFEAADQRLMATEQRLLATFRAEMVIQTRTMVFANLASVFTGVSLAFVAARLS